jgi:hypothetical protein
MADQSTESFQTGQTARNEEGFFKSVKPFSAPRSAKTFDEMGVPFHEDVPDPSESKTNRLASTVRNILNLKISVGKANAKSSRAKNNRRGARPVHVVNDGTDDPKLPTVKPPAPDTSKTWISPLKLPSPVSTTSSSNKDTMPDSSCNA